MFQLNKDLISNFLDIIFLFLEILIYFELFLFFGISKLWKKIEKVPKT